jgi:hypothetical protein
MILQLLMAAMLGVLFGVGIAACCIVAGRADDTPAADAPAADAWRYLTNTLYSRGWRNVTPDLIVSLLPDVRQTHDVDA